MRNETPDHPPTIDPFDRLSGTLEGIASFTEPFTHVETTPLIGLVQTFIVRTARQPEIGDYAFITYVDGTRHVRIVLPPKVVNALIRQRDQLTAKSRRAHGKRLAEHARQTTDRAELLARLEKARKARRRKTGKK